MLASDRASGGPSDFVPVRTRFFDDLVTAEAMYVDQVVLLGAGFDTRAYRMQLPERLAWFELDDAPLLDEKERVLAAAGAFPICRRLPVPADVTGDWRERLAGFGFAAGGRTLWLAEGLLFYLGPDVVAAMLAEARRLSGPGSLFAADVSGTGLVRAAGMAAYLLARSSRKLPPPFATDDPAGLFRGAGWPQVDLFEPGPLARQYGRPMRVSGTRSRLGASDPTMRTYFVVARSGE